MIEKGKLMEKGCEMLCKLESQKLKLIALSRYRFTKIGIKLVTAIFIWTKKLKELIFDLFGDRFNQYLVKWVIDLNIFSKVLYSSSFSKIFILFWTFRKGRNWISKDFKFDIFWRHRRKGENRLKGYLPLPKCLFYNNNCVLGATCYWNRMRTDHF